MDQLCFWLVQCIRMLAKRIKICLVLHLYVSLFLPPGWQSRWFVLDGGVLSYYLSAEDVRLGCRGSVRMASCSLRGEGWAAISHVAVCITELES